MKLIAISNNILNSWCNKLHVYRRPTLNNCLTLQYGGNNMVNHVLYNFPQHCIYHFPFSRRYLCSVCLVDWFLSQGDVSIII